MFVFKMLELLFPQSGRWFLQVRDRVVRPALVQEHPDRALAPGTHSNVKRGPALAILDVWACPKV